MEVFGQLFTLCTDVLNISFKLFGHEVSLFAMFMYVLIGGFLIKLFYLVFGD